MRRVFDLSAGKIDRLCARWDPDAGHARLHRARRLHQPGLDGVDAGLPVRGAPAAVRRHAETRASWRSGRRATVAAHGPHLTHVGVHDHGFNNVSTYGNLLRLMREGRLPADPWERGFYELALKVSGAVQAARWTRLGPDLGYVYSFNGPHSLFADTIRSLRALAVGHQLGHVLMGEGDRPISLLARLLQHAETTARFNVYFGTGPRRLRRARAGWPTSPSST